MKILQVEGLTKLKDLKVISPPSKDLSKSVYGACKFVFPSALRIGLHSMASEGFDKSDLLFALFLDIIRRFTGQVSANADFCLNGGQPRRATLEDNFSVRETLYRLRNCLLAVPLSGIPQNAVTAEAEFSFSDDNCLQQSEETGQRSSAIRLSLVDSAESLSGVIEYDRKVWNEAFVESLAAHYQNLLRSALANPDSPMSMLPILDEPGIQLLDSWNLTHFDTPPFCVDELFRQRAAETPDYPAVTFEGRSLSYRFVSEQTDRLASRLRDLGVGRGEVVGICMDRSSEMVIALMAVLRAGGAFLPLDPGFPVERIAFMQEDARPLVVITQSHLEQKHTFAVTHVLCFDSVDHPLTAHSQLPPASARLDDLAYVLYTSGSTGKPKGVEITHRALTNLLAAVTLELPLCHTNVFLATSTISFDISVYEIFAPLVAGAHLVVAPRSVAVSGELLANAIRDNGITHLQATPSGWRILLEAEWQGHPALKMITAGEPLDRTLAQRLLERGAGLWNLYGPTEATIYCTGGRVTADDKTITVGRPLANYTSYVLDGNRNRLPIGAVGELYVGGVGVACGYLNRPELTAEKFIENPFANDRNNRLYRTGDLARFLPDGQIELLGRADNQIKLRGYRIELEEIESLLDSHPVIRKSIVKVVDLGEGDQRLVAYVVTRTSDPIDETQLRKHALRGLPWYMVPATFVVVDAFALTPNGKIDRKSLPLPVDLKTTELIDAPPSPVLDNLETTILSCWRSVLGLPNLDLDYNFFEVGGHSLLAARMFSQINRALDLNLPIGILVETPTPRLLAERIREMQKSPIGCLVPMQPKGVLPPLYIVHHLLGDVLLYRALAEAFAPDRPVIGVQAPVDLTERAEAYSIESLATRYIGEMLEQQSAGPFHLAGFSSGGLLAYEMARQLSARGHEVGMLALIDADIKTPSGLPKPALYWKITVRKLAKIVFKFKDELKEGPYQFVGKRLRFVWFLWTLRNLEKSSYLGQPGKRTVQQALALAENAYSPQPYVGSALLIRFHDEAWLFGPDPLMGWGKLVQGKIEIVDRPGGHITGMDSIHAVDTASVLTAHMASLSGATVRRESARAATV